MTVDEILKVSLTSGFSILATIVIARAARVHSRAEKADAEEKAARAAQISGQHEVQKAEMTNGTELLRIAYDRLQKLEAARDATLGQMYDARVAFDKERGEWDDERQRLRREAEAERVRVEAEIEQIKGAFHAAETARSTAETALQHAREATRK